MLDQLAVLELVTGQVDAGLAGVRHHHADVADLDDRLGDHLDGREEPVDEVGAVDQRLQLTAAETTGPEERLGVLEVVVIRLGVSASSPRVGAMIWPSGSDGAVVHGDDADQIVGVFDYDRFKSVAFTNELRHASERLGLRAIECEEVHAFAGEDDELRGVQGVGSFAQDLALRSALPAGAQECRHVLKIVCDDIARQRLRRR